MRDRAPVFPGSGAPRRPANRTSIGVSKERAPGLPAPQASEGSHPVAFRPNPAIVAGAVMGTLLAAAAYIALSGAAPVGAHITEVKPINGATQSSTQGATDTVAPAAQESQSGQDDPQGEDSATSAAQGAQGP